MKKLVFLTMVFGLMTVFSGSISAQERSGWIEPTCAGITPKVRDSIYFHIHNKKATHASVQLIRGNGELFSERIICQMTIEVDPAFSQRWFDKVVLDIDGGGYTATVNHVRKDFEVLQKGFLVKWQPLADGDLFVFTTADGKREVGRVNAMFNDPKNPPR